VSCGLATPPRLVVGTPPLEPIGVTKRSKSSSRPESASGASRSKWRDLNPEFLVAAASFPLILTPNRGRVGRENACLPNREVALRPLAAARNHPSNLKGRLCDYEGSGGMRGRFSPGYSASRYPSTNQLSNPATLQPSSQKPQLPAQTPRQTLRSAECTASKDPSAYGLEPESPRSGLSKYEHALR
jgi:hypothetical protein